MDKAPVQLGDARSTEGAVGVRDKAGLGEAVAPQDGRGRVRHLVHLPGAQLQPQANMWRLQKDHGGPRAGHSCLVYQAQIWHLHIAQK